MNCPVCQQVIQTIQGEDADHYYCPNNDHYNNHTYSHVVPYQKDKTEAFSIALSKLVIMHNHYPFQDQPFWWTIRIPHKTINEIILAGCNQLSPEQACQLLRRHEKLLVFI